MNTGANCTNSGAITLTVTPAPTAPTLAVNSPVCTGSSVNLTSNTIAGATYSWSGPNGFTSTLEDPTIPIALPADAGTYTCTVDVAGCTSSSTVNVAVNPKPQAIILGVSTTFCANETFTLDGSNSLHNSSAITNFQWQLNGVDIVGANAATYTGNTPGSYKLVVTNDLGCVDTTLTPNIANADPIPTPIINGANGFCFGGNATLDGTTSGAGGASVIDNYEWLLNGVSVGSGPTNDTYLATAGGDYQLIVLNSNGCKDTTALFTVTEHATPKFT
ncbi:MAG: immunoglobulin domain-containing protein [Bacteroidetes bacterium]|nr:immunoglobulin domain-containing protein [Bacteroidota bacterium]